MTHPTLRTLLARVGDRERGSATIWMVVGAFILIVMVGLAVDGAGQVHAQQRASDVAAQAARVGGQQINAPLAMRGRGVEADPGQAVQAARSYLAAAGVDGTVSIEGGTLLRVRTTDTYNAVFLRIIGIQTLPVSGEAEARIVRVVNGVER